MSWTDIPLTLNPILSPGIASASYSWCISTVLQSPLIPVGPKVMCILGFIIPVSTLPTGTVPIPEILYASYIGILSGLWVGLFGGLRESRASRSVGPLYQGMFADNSFILSPFHPDIGIKGIFSTLYPINFKYYETSSLISKYLSSK